jgi:hypothetical protein
MRKEYDFRHGTRGKQAGKRFRIVGDERSHDAPKMGVGTQVNVRDLKEPEVSNDTPVKREL